MKLLVINVPWMKYYVGEGDEEKQAPTCGYNFQYVNGYYYGKADEGTEIALENFDGVSESDEYVDDITVVWTANNRHDTNKVIGWYKHARVYRKLQSKLSLDSERTIFDYQIVAPAKESLLLPVELRLLDIKENSEIIHIETDEQVLRDLSMYIHNYSGDQMNYIFAKKDLEGQSILNFEEYEMYFAKADEFLAKDLYGKAVRCFNKAIAVEPELAIGYECKGSVLLSLKMYDEALAVYNKVIELEPDNEQAHYCKGLISGLLGDYETAVKELDFYLSIRKQDLLAMYERGIVHYNLGNMDKAQADFEYAHKKEKEVEVYNVIMSYINK